MKKNRIYLFLFFISISLLSCYLAKDKSSTDEKWEMANEILNNIIEPVFPDTVYNILDFGAVADNKTLNTKAIIEAVEQAHKNGGGKVLIPGGVFLTGAIHLKSNVVLHLDDSAQLNFSTNTADYLPIVLTRWEGVDCYNYSPLIYAYEQENIGITGKGKLNGQGNENNWLLWKGKKEYGWTPGTPNQSDPQARPLLMKFNNEQTPVEERIMGDGHYLRPPFIQFYKCKNILIEDVTIEQSPFWVIHPLLSENIIVRGVTVNSNGANNDGCDPESCKNILIENCDFSTGDDCIALKSGRNSDGRKWNMPVENVVIRNCKMQNGHGGVVIGSEITGGSKNIFVENCEMSSPELDRAIRIKTNNNRGGIIENLYVRNIKVGQVKEAVIKIECVYESSEGDGNYPPLIKNIFIEGISSQKSKYAMHMVGIKGINCIENIQISDCQFSGVEKESVMENTGKILLRGIKINNKIVN